VFYGLISTRVALKGLIHLLLSQHTLVWFLCF